MILVMPAGSYCIAVWTRVEHFRKKQSVFQLFYVFIDMNILWSSSQHLSFIIKQLNAFWHIENYTQGHKTILMWVNFMEFISFFSVTLKYIYEQPTIVELKDDLFTLPCIHVHFIKSLQTTNPQKKRRKKEKLFYCCGIVAIGLTLREYKVAIKLIWWRSD